MQSQTLMTPSEVAKFSGVKLPFNPCSFDQLHQIEYYQARTCLGFDLWEDMVAALADYSATQEWDKDSTYNTDDLVKFRGLVYVCLAADVTSMPTVATDWSLAPKFAAGECQETYDKFFCLFLAPYLAKRILHERLPFIKTRIQDIGVVEYGDARYDTAEEDSVARLQHAINRDAAIAWGNLQHYMEQTEQKDNSCLSGYIAYQKDDDCGTSKKGCNPNRIRTGIYRFG